MSFMGRIVNVAGLILVVSACSSKLDYYSGPDVDAYRSHIAQQCVINVKGQQDEIVRSFKCTEDCSIWISGLYKGPDEWRRISFTLFARTNTPVYRNTYGSLYHNLESNEIICGRDNFAQKYPSIDWLKINKYLPDEPDPERSNVYPVSEEDWRK